MRALTYRQRAAMLAQAVKLLQEGGTLSAANASQIADGASGMTLTKSGDGTQTLTWRHLRPWRTDQRLYMRLRAAVP